MANFNHRRFFIILRVKDTGFELHDKEPSGYCKIDIKNNRIKFFIYVQDLLPQATKAGIYEAYIVSSREEKPALKLTDIFVDDRGRVECTVESDAETLKRTTKSLEEFSAIAIVYKSLTQTEKLFYPLVGSAGKRTEIDWSGRIMSDILKTSRTEAYEQRIPDEASIQSNASIENTNGRREMKTKTKIVVIEDNQNTRELIKSFILAQDDMEIAGTAENGFKGLELIEKKKPDVIIMDMIMPRMDGLEVLERINAFNPEYSPSVICLSAVAQEDMIRKAVDLGAKYYMLKPFDFNIIIKRIRELSQSNGVASAVSAPSHKVANVEARISDIFLLVGIPAHIRGYHFLREAIKMVIEDKDCINRITKQLYPDVAKRFNTTPSKVERAIRHAIDVAWSRGKAEGINQAFGYTVYGNYDKPTNGEFIAIVADKLSIENMN